MCTVACALLYHIVHFKLFLKIAYSLFFAYISRSLRYEQIVCLSLHPLFLMHILISLCFVSFIYIIVKHLLSNCFDKYCSLGDTKSKNKAGSLNIKLLQSSEGDRCTNNNNSFFLIVK